MKAIKGPEIDPRYEVHVPVYFLNGLGLMASGKRIIKDIRPFQHYFPKATGDDTPYNKGEFVRTGKVLELIEDKVRRYHSDTQRFSQEYIAKGIPRKSPHFKKEVCQRLHRWLIEHVAYRPDTEGREELRRPARVVEDATTGVDCDCYTYFISTVLTNLGIDHHLRIIAVGNATAYHHIYVVVPKSSGSLMPYSNKQRYIVIDPVLDRFDDEPEDIRAYHDYPMKISPTNSFNGLGTPFIDEVYQKLQVTRRLMQQDPESYRQQGIIPHVAIGLIDQALQAWYTPQRDAVLSTLTRIEHQMYTGGLNGSMNGFFKNLSNKVKQAVDTSVSTVRNVVHTAVTDPKKLVTTTVDKAKDLINQAIDYGRTGALFIPRKAFMALVELNVRGLASKLNKGLSHPSTASRIQRFWVGDFGGEMSNLTNAIRRGANRPFLFGLQGLAGDPATVTSLTASAGAVLAAIQPILDAIDKLFKTGQAAAQIIDVGKDVVQVFSPPSAPQLPSSNPPLAIEENFDIGNPPSAAYVPVYQPENKNNNTLLWVGGTVAAGLLLYGLSKNAQSKKGLNGLQGKKSKKTVAHVSF